MLRGKGVWLINWGGWLLLSAVFSLLVMVVQRAEASRRRPTAVIMLLEWGVVFGYGIFRISGQCDFNIGALCQNLIERGRSTPIAWNTTNLAAATALLFNLLFWVVIGRYNPPRSSADIKVLGLND
jgi:hypothetical protein